MKVTVFHNNNSRDAMCFGYRGVAYGESVTEVTSFLVSPTESALDACEEAYFITNVGNEPGFGATPTQYEAASTYRNRRNRSLSVGDVVCVEAAGDTGWYAVASCGFETIEKPVVNSKVCHGTTPVDMDLETAARLVAEQRAERLSAR